MYGAMNGQPNGAQAPQAIQPGQAGLQQCAALLQQIQHLQVRVGRTAGCCAH